MKKLTAAAFLLVFGLAAVAVAQESAIKSDNALAYLTIDIENTPGWVAKIKGGYQWKLFRSVGLEVADGVNGAVSHSKNHTEDGLAGSVSLGYNFGRFPLTLGLQFGLGPDGQMSQRSVFGGGRSLYSHQNVKIYTLDLSADYDFRNCSRWTPFIGVTAGAAFINQRGHAEYNDGQGNLLFGSMGQRKRVNFMTGARAGVKYATA